MTKNSTLGTSSAAAALAGVASLQATLDLASEAFFTLDVATLSYVVVNVAGCALAGRSREEVLQLGPTGLWADGAAGQQHLVQLCDRLVRQAPTAAIDRSSLLRPDGSLAALLVERRATQVEGRWLVVECCRAAPTDEGPKAIPADTRQEADLERFRVAIDQIDETYFLIDPVALRYVDINEAACRMYGYTREELMATGPQLVSSSSPEELRARYQKLIDSRETDHGELTHRHRDGTQFVVKYSRRAILSGGRWLIMATARNVSHEKQSLARLEFLAAAINFDSDAVFLIDRTSMRAVEVNEAACRQYGLLREEVLRAELWGPGRRHATRQEQEAAYDALIDRYPASEVEVVRTQRPGAKVATTEIQRQALRIDGRWIILARMRDVTEREAVRRDLERFRTAADQVADAIVLIDRETLRYVDVNETACRLYGYTREEFLALSPQQLRVTSTTEQVIAATYDAIIARYPEIEMIEGEGRRSDGTAVPLEITWRAMRSEGRWLIVGTGRDISERKAAQRDLERFRMAVDQVADGIMLVDRETMRYVDVNQTACRLYGYTREQFLDMSPHRLRVTEATPQEMAATYDAIIERYPEVDMIEGEGRRADGSIVPLEITRRAMHSGGRWLIVGTSRDITERKAAQRSLERFRLAMDRSLDSLALIDRETMAFIDVNEEGARTLGVTKEEFLRTAPWDHNGGTREQSAAIYDEAIAVSPRTIMRKGTRHRPDGTSYPVEVCRTAVQIDGRWIIAVSARDISEREAAQASLQRFRAAIDEAGDGILLTDVETLEYLDMNETACRMFGYSREQMMAMGPTRISANSPMGNQKSVRERQQEAIDAYPNLVRRDVTFRRPDGSAFDAEVSRRAVKVGGKWVVISTIRDISERKAAQASLQRFRAALDQSADMIVVIDRETLTYADVNTTACQFFGYEREEMLRVAPSQLSAMPETREQLAERYDKLIAMAPTPLVSEGPQRRKDGTLVEMETIRRAVQVEGKWLILVTGRDISDRRAAQASLQRFRAAIDQAGDGIVLIDADTVQYLNVNDTACRMFGYSREQMMAMGPLNVSAGTVGNVEAAQERYNEAIRAYPELITEELTFPRADGSSFDAEVSRRALSMDGKWIIIATIRDVSERKAAQAGLERFRAAIDQAADGIVLTDIATMNYLDVNETACRMFGYSREQMIALGPVGVSAGSDMGDVSSVRERQRQAMEAYPNMVTRELPFKRADGTTFDAEVSRRALELNGQWIIISSIRDVSERKAAQARFERMRAAIDQSGDGLFLIDPAALTYVDVNQSACQMAECSREELMARGPISWLSTGTSEEKLQYLRTAYKEVLDAYPRTVRGEATYSRSNGQPCPVEYQRRAIRSGDQWIVLSTMRDISERKAAETNLHRFRVAIDQAGDAIVFFDADTLQYVDVNATACEMFGYTREQMMAMGPVKAMGVDVGGFEGMWQRCQLAIQAFPKAMSNEMRYRRANGSLFDVEVGRRAISLDGKWFIIATIRDITERKAAQARLERMRAAIDQAGDAILLIDPEAVEYLDINDTACQMFGYTREQMMANGPVNVAGAPSGGIERMRERFRQVIEACPNIISDEMQYARSDGSLFYAEVSRRALLLEGAWIIISTIRDITDRKVTQARLERFRAAIDQAGDAIVVFDADTLQYVDVNDTACQMFGYTRDQMMAMGPVKVAGTDVGGFEGMWQRCQNVISACPNIVANELQYKRADGTLFDVDVARRAISLDGKWFIIATIRDITERKATQFRLERFRAAIDQVGDAIVLYDAITLEYVDVNDTACRMFGYTRDQMMSLGVVGVTGAALEGPEVLRARSQTVVEAYPEIVTTELRYTRADGSQFDSEISRRALSVDGRWVIVATIRDISESKAAQAKLERFREAVDQSGDGIVLVDPDTLKYIEVNETICKMAACTRQELLAKGPLAWRTSGSVEEHNIYLKAHYARMIELYPKAVTAEFEIRRADGEVFPVESERRAIRSEGRWVILITMRDISDRKRAEAQLKRRMDDLARSNQELERFAYVASHDLSEPLRMIASYTQLLNRRYKGSLDEDGREFMGYVVLGAQRMKQVIDDLLMYSNVGRSTRKPVEMNLDGVLDEALKNVRQHIGDIPVGIERVALPSIVADRSDMVRLFENLVGNAVKFRGEQDPVVRIGVSEDPEGWTFTVDDNGIGIEPQYFERIFVIFQRLHSREKYEGTGIGLAICKKIVEYRGGRIWVESVSGRGARFSFSLPKALPDGLDVAAT